MPAIPSTAELLKRGVHFGHKKSRRHPKMEEFIFTVKGDLCIIDVRKTIEHLKAALAYITEVTAKGGVVLMVSTKKQSHTLLAQHAESCGAPYINGRWLGGTLTNFAVISQLIKKFKKLKGDRETGAHEKFTKKEQLDLTREIEELDLSIGGIQNLNKLPDAVFILDLKKDKTALTEALKKGIPIVAVCDTNANPDGIAHIIPANDDAIKSIELMLGLVASAINEGKAKYAAGKTEVAKPEDKPTEVKA